MRSAAAAYTKSAAKQSKNHVKICTDSNERKHSYPSPSNLMAVSPKMRKTSPTDVFSLQSMPSKHDSSTSLLFCCSWSLLRSESHAVCCCHDAFTLAVRLAALKFFKSFSMIKFFVPVFIGVANKLLQLFENTFVLIDLLGAINVEAIICSSSDSSIETFADLRFEFSSLLLFWFVLLPLLFVPLPFLTLLLLIQLLFMFWAFIRLLKICDVFFRWFGFREQDTTTK